MIRPLIIAALAGALLTAAAAEAAPIPRGAVLTGHQVGYCDGDTLTIGGIGVRLKGVSAPERHTPEGKAARAFLCTLVEGKLIRCTLTGETNNKRAVGFCKAGRKDLNAAMVASGHARACPRYTDRYVPLEAQPRAAQIGVWASGYVLPEYCHVKANQ